MELLSRRNVHSRTESVGKIKLTTNLVIDNSNYNNNNRNPLGNSYVVITLRSNDSSVIIIKIVFVLTLVLIYYNAVSGTRSIMIIYGTRRRY